MLKYIVLVFILLVITNGFTYYLSSSYGMHDAMQGMTSNLEGKYGKEFDRAFLEDMIIHHNGAIEMAKMAKDRSQSDKIRSLSSEIIKAQEEEVIIMKMWLSSIDG